MGGQRSMALLILAQKGIGELVTMQRDALGK